MNLITKLQWEIQQSYIQTLLKAGVNPVFLHKGINSGAIDNDMMADFIRALTKLGVIK